MTSLSLDYSIRKSGGKRLCAPHPGLSQLITSFFASESQGIPHALLVTFSNFSYSCFFSLRKPRPLSPPRLACQAFFFQYVNELVFPFGNWWLSRNRILNNLHIRTRMNRQTLKIWMRSPFCDEVTPERRYSSHTFRYGYLVTT